MSIDDLAYGQGELAISLEYDPISADISIEAYTPLPQDTRPIDIAAVYLSHCHSDAPSLRDFLHSDTSDTSGISTPPQPKPHQRASAFAIVNARTPLAVFAGKKYKPVALKVRPVETELPSRFCITCEIKGDPLLDIPQLSLQPSAYQPTGRYTEEHKEIIDRAHPSNFLLPEEHTLMHHFMSVQNAAFVWMESECGHFREDFFPPIKILTISHKPWAQRNIPIPPGIYEEVCWIIKAKLNAGVYEPSNSSYRSRWFCITKKDGKSLLPPEPRYLSTDLV